jgi:hypothetical protein
MRAPPAHLLSSSDFSFGIVIANVSVEFVNFEHHNPRLALGTSYGPTSLEIGVRFFRNFHGTSKLGPADSRS